VVTKYLGMFSDPPSGSCLLFLPLDSNVMTDQRETATGFGSLLSLVIGNVLPAERPGAEKGAPTGAAKRTLYREDRSAIMAEEGKQRERSGRF
jgi:hypothetical protein